MGLGISSLGIADLGFGPDFSFLEIGSLCFSGQWRAALGMVSLCFAGLGHAVLGISLLSVPSYISTLGSVTFLIKCFGMIYV